MLNYKLIKISPKVESKLPRLSHHQLSYLTAANDIEINQISKHGDNLNLIYANFCKS